MRSAAVSFRLALIAGFIGCLMALACAAQSLQVIELRHRTAEEVMPALQPLLEKGGALSGQDYTLFVRASAANVEQLRAVLARIDRAPRQLRVSVRRAAADGADSATVAGSGTVRTERGALSAGGGEGRASGASVQAAATHATRADEQIASVLVLEGGSAAIAAGVGTPIVTVVAGRTGRRPWAAGVVEQRELQRGFIVTPRIAADAVVLDIEQQSETLQDGRIETERLATQITAPLGQWVLIGGSRAQTSSRSTGILRRTQQTQRENLSIWVKVEEAQ